MRKSNKDLTPLPLSLILVTFPLFTFLMLFNSTFFSNTIFLFPFFHSYVFLPLYRSVPSYFLLLLFNYYLLYFSLIVIIIFLTLLAHFSSLSNPILKTFATFPSFLLLFIHSSLLSFHCLLSFLFSASSPPISSSH